MQTLKDDLGLEGVDFYRCGINPEHFGELTADPVPLKKSDRRAKKFVEKHGETCYELDAFHPVRLQELVEESIKRFTDLDALNCNFEQQERDLRRIKELRRKILKFAGTMT
jgi:hypothetical protein